MADYASLSRKLQEKIADKPQRAAWISLYCDLTAAQAETDVSRCAIRIDAGTIKQRLESGLPLLAAENFIVDRTAFIELRHKICAIVAHHRVDLVTRIDKFRACFDEGQASNLKWALLLYEGRQDFGEEDRMDRSLLAFVLNQSLRPFLHAYAQTLLPFVDETIWYRRHCPICGGLPDFAALTKSEGARRLLCSRCDTEWTFWRTGCPFCTTDDSNKQEYSISEDRVYRLYACETCGHYLKTIDLREVADERLLPVERILTLPIDATVEKFGLKTLPRNEASN